MGQSSSSQPECCPPDSLPGATAAARGELRTPRGKEHVLEAEGKQFAVYVTHPPAGVATKGAVVFNHDIFGYGAGRSLQVADDIAARGYVVALPDYFQTKGEPWQRMSEESHVYWPPWSIFTGPSVLYGRARQPWSKVEARLLATIKLLRSEAGANVRVATVGACYGGWVATRTAALAQPPVVCAVGWHASPLVQKLQSSGPSEQEMLAAVKVPIMMAQSWTDQGYTKPGSWWFKALNAPGAPTEGSEAHLFSEVLHGWMLRGDMRDATVKRDVALTLDKTAAFLDRFVAGEGGRSRL